jgi:hypothetical protein
VKAPRPIANSAPTASAIERVAVALLQRRTF